MEPREVKDVPFQIAFSSLMTLWVQKPISFSFGIASFISRYLGVLEQSLEINLPGQVLTLAARELRIVVRVSLMEAEAKKAKCSGRLRGWYGDTRE